MTLDRLEAFFPAQPCISGEDAVHPLQSLENYSAWRGTRLAFNDVGASTIAEAASLLSMAQAHAAAHPALRGCPSRGHLPVEQIFRAEEITQALIEATDQEIAALLSSISSPERRACYSEWATAARRVLRRRGRASDLGGGRLRMGTGPSMFTIFEAIAHSDAMKKVRTGVVAYSAKGGRSVELRAEDAPVGTLSDVRDRAAARLASRLYNHRGVALKVLIGAYLAWERESGGDPKRLVEISVTALMRASGLKLTSKPNAGLQQTYIDAFLSLTSLYVDVPEFDYMEKGAKTKAMGIEPLLTVRRMGKFGNLFGEDDAYRGDPTITLEFVPANFWIQMMRGSDGKRRQYQPIPSALLSYNADTQRWPLWLGVFWSAHIRRSDKHARQGATELILGGDLLLEANNLTQNPNQQGRVIPKLIEAHELLVRDGILRGVRFEDPGSHLSPKKRLNGFKVVATLPDRDDV